MEDELYKQSVEPMEDDLNEETVEKKNNEQTTNQNYANLDLERENDELNKQAVEIEINEQEETNAVISSRTRSRKQKVPAPENAIGPVPKLCLKPQCRHLIERGLHFNRTDLLKTYRGICPSCGIKPKAETERSRIPLHSLMKTHLLYNCEKYPP